MKRLVTLLFLLLPALAQAQIATIPPKPGAPVTSLPASCSVARGDLVFLTTGPDPGLYECSGGTYAKVGGGASYDQDLNTDDDVTFASVALGTGPFASTGTIKLANATSIVARNAGDTGDLVVIEATAGNQINIGDTATAAAFNMSLDQSGAQNAQSNIGAGNAGLSNVFGASIGMVSPTTDLGGDLYLSAGGSFLSGTSGNVLIFAAGTGGSSVGGNITLDVSGPTIGKVIITALPTSDPNVAGQLWNSTGTVKVSAGP